MLFAATERTSKRSPRKSTRVAQSKLASRKQSFTVEPLEDRRLLAVGATAGSETTQVWTAAEVFQSAAVSTSVGPLAAPTSPNLQTIEWRNQQTVVKTGEWIVKVTNGPSTSLLTPREQLLASHLDLEVLRELGSADLLLIKTAADVTLAELADGLAGVPGFQYVEPNVSLAGMSTMPNDTHFLNGNQWSMHNTGQSGGMVDADIDSPEAWDLHTGTGNVVVAVFDTGVDYYHPDLAANIWINPGEIAGNGIDDDGSGYVDDVRGWDYIDNDNDPMDENYHGTAVAGIIGAVGNNGLGVAGINWNVKILPVRILGEASGGDEDASVAGALLGIRYINKLKRDLGINIVAANHSWGTGFSTPLGEAIAESAALGITHIASAGNQNHDNDRTPIYPASYPYDNVISVAATNRSDIRSSYSSFGRNTVHLGAPADQTYTTYINGGYTTFSGTSAAAPHVTGAVALLSDAFPGATYQEIKQAIMDGVNPLSTLATRTISGGRLNLYNAFLELALRVNSSTPAADTVVTTPPLDFELTFSHIITPGSVDASDLLVNSIPADSVTVGSQSAVFHYSVSPVTAQGEQSMELLAGSITRLVDGGPINAFAANFRYDALPLAVTATSPTAGDVVSSSLFTISVDFNEPFDPLSIDLADLTLSQGSVYGYFHADADTVQFYVMDVDHDGVLTAQLAAGALTDPYGNPSLPFSTSFDIDGIDAPVLAFERLEPLGSLISSSMGNRGIISSATDEDYFLFSAAAGETIALYVAPEDPATQLSVEILGLSGVLTAAVPGAPVVLPATMIPISGTYSLRISGDSRSSYQLDAYRNATFEGVDSTTDAPLDMDNSFLALGSGRWAVVGRSTPRQVIIEPDDFAVGTRLNEAIPGLILADSSNPSASVTSVSSTIVAAGTGSHVFGSPSFGETGFGNSNRLDIQLDAPVRAVTALVGSNDSFDQSFLALYDEHGFFINQVYSNSLSLGRWQQISWDAGTAQIARVQIGSTSSVDRAPIDRIELRADEVDEYELDLTSTLGRPVDIALTGVDGVNFSSARLELIGPTEGVVALGSPLGHELANVDLAIANYLVTEPGVYRLRVTTETSGDYSLLVTEHLLFDFEGNDLSVDPLRSLDDVAGASGYLAAEFEAGTIDFQIDSDLSSLTLSGIGDFLGEYPMDEQAPGSLTTQFRGTVRATIDGDQIVFDFGSHIEAIDHPGNFLPGFAPADFAGQFDLTEAGLGIASATIRDAVLDLFGDPLTLNPDGSFSLDGISTILEGELAASIPGLISQSVSGGVLLDNVAVDSGQFARDGGYWHLTVPIDMRVDIPVPVSFTSIVIHLELTGEIVGRARAPLPVDIYEITLSAGETVTFRTADPLGNAAELLENSLDPYLAIRDLEGNLLGWDDNSVDGRHATLAFVAPSTGIYRVEVTAVSGSGEYLLDVDGHAGSDPLAFEVLSSTPADGAIIGVPLGEITVDFTGVLDLDSVQAADLTVDSTPAASVEVVDANTLRFVLATVLTDGEHEIRLAADALRNIADEPLSAYVGHVRVDTTGPRVVSTSIQQGDTVSTAALTYVVTFDEPLLEINLDTFDFFVWAEETGAVSYPTSFDYDDVTHTLTLHFGAFVEGDYQLQLTSGDFSLEDSLGNDLDGELLISPLPPHVSGDGIAGGNFIVEFRVDQTSSSFPTPLIAKSPLGSLIYDPIATGMIQGPDDVDEFTLDVDAGQTITVVATGTGALRATLELFAPSGESLGTAQAPSAGGAALLQATPAGESGTYRIAVRGILESEGGYTVQVILNAELEEESYDQGNNDLLAGAQDLDDSFLTLVGSAQRAAVLGQADRQSSLQQNNVYFPNVLPFVFDNLPTNIGTGSLRVDAIADLDTSSEYLDLYAEGQFLSRLFNFAAGDLELSTATVPLSAELLEFLNADGVVEFSVVPSAPVQNFGTSSLRMTLSYGGGADLYRFTLAPGQFTTVALTGGGSAASLDLLDEFGNVVASGTDDATNTTRAIRDFESVAGGTYYVRASAELNTQYSVVVTRDTAFDAEGNNSIDSAQNIDGTRTVLGHLGRGSTTTSTGPVVSLPRVLFDGDNFRWDISSNGSIVDGTNDAYDGGMVNQGFGSLGSGSTEADGRETVIGPIAVSQGISVTRKIFVPSDRGFARYLEIVTNTSSSPIDYTVPIFTNLGSDGFESVLQTSSGDSAFTTADNWLLTDDTDGFGDPTVLHVIAGAEGIRPSWTQFSPGAVQYNYTLSLAPGETQIVMHFAAQSSSVAAGLAKATQLESLGLGALEDMSPDELSLLINFPAGSSADFYEVSLQAGEIVSIDTSTPGDGPGEFVNLLDPAIEIFDANGVLLASNDNGATDGRNVHLTFTALEAGPYFVRVFSAGEHASGGEYVLAITPFPEARLSGPSVVLAGNEYAFGLSGLSSNQELQSGAFTYELDWDGDGAADESVAGGDITSVLHTFGQPGLVNVGVAVFDSAGNPSGTAELQVAVVALSVAPDGEHPELSNLIWTGTGGNDQIAFHELGDGIIRAVVSQVQGWVLPTSFETELAGITGGLLANALGGDDLVDGRPLVTLAATLDGGQGHDTLFGGRADDLLLGDSADVAGDGAEGNDVLDGGAGNDQIYGDGVDGAEGGNDALVGGEGDDQLYGDSTADGLEGGNDTLLGSMGRDLLVGRGGDDQLFGGTGNDTLLGGKDHDLLIGDGSSLFTDSGESLLVDTTDDDLLDGGEGNDSLLGEAGNDLLYGNTGDDALSGGTGDDFLEGGSGADHYLFEGTALGGDFVNDQPGGAFDYLVFLGFQHAISIDIGVTTEQDIANGQLLLTLSSATGIEGVVGTSFDDHLVGNSGNNLLYGNGGADELRGGQGRDFLIGDAGADSLFGEEGDDLLLGGRFGIEYDDPARMFAQIMAEWTSANAYVARVEHLSGASGGANHHFDLTPGEFVFDDAAVDQLSGGDDDLDWFLYSLLQDVLTDHELEEALTDTTGF